MKILRFTKEDKEKLKNRINSSSSKFIDNFKGFGKDNYLTYTD